MEQRTNAVLAKLITREEKTGDYSISELTECYNIALERMERGDKVVKGFRDHPTAVRRVEGVLVELRALEQIDRRDKVPTPGRDRYLASGKAEEIRQEVLADQAKASKVAARPTAPDPAPGPRKASDYPKPKGKGKNGRRAAWGDSDKITILVEGNPKRGTAAERYALYHTGMTVGAYIKAIGGSRSKAWRDLRHDIRNGWISVA